MKINILLVAFLILPLLADAQDNKWDNIVVTENTEVFIDSTNIKMIDNQVFATIKTIYTTVESRQAYTDKIKSVFKKDADKKIKKWENFSYNITYGIYDCSNNRFKILKVEDFDNKDKRIVKTEVKENKARWLNVDTNTVGDYTLFYICDYRTQ